MNMIKMIILVMITINLSGCVSYMAIKSEREGVRARGHEEEVTAWQVITNNPTKFALSALADAALIWGTYEGVQYLAGKNEITNKREQNQNAQRDNISIEITGNNNTVNISGDSTVTEVPVVVVPNNY
jgi:uncharacterized protein YceK